MLLVQYKSKQLLLIRSLQRLQFKRYDQGHMFFFASDRQTHGQTEQLEPQGALIAHLSTMSTSVNKLDWRVKNLTSEWNQKQQHFISHAFRSLLCIRFVAVAFQSEEEVFEEETPSPFDLFLPHPGSAPGRIWPKHLNACAGSWELHPYQVS